ncbi:MAG: hypothetical protein IT204_01775 [Fimbriimonadaceae bacterium]|nr:hypothetical protein [Fimbriimonadaceae bacterium]
MMRNDEALALCEEVLALTSGDAEVTCTSDTEALLRIANNEPIQHSEHLALHLKLRLRDGARYGEAEVDSTDPTALEGLVARAAQQMQWLPPDQEPVASVGPQGLLAVEAWHRDTSAAEFGAAERAAAGEALVAASVAAGYAAAGVVTNSEAVVAKATSNGFRGAYRATEARYDVTVQTADSTGWRARWARSRSVLDAAAVGAEAAATAAATRQPQRIEPGDYRVVLAPAAVAVALGFLSGGFNAKAVEEGRCWLAGKVGQQVAGDNIHLRQDICHPGLQGIPFDDDGYALRRVELLQGGVANHLLYDRRTAARAGQEATGYAAGGLGSFGAGPSALVLEGGQASPDDLLAACGDGLYIARLWYANWVDPTACSITAMTRDGVWRIRDGKLAEPLTNARIVQNLLELFSGVEALGVPEVSAGIVAPAICARSFGINTATSF